MVTLNKVTAFVTRGESAVRELLVCRHESMGVQIPTGIAEAGETVQAAVLRQVAETTGLGDLTIRALLATLDHPLTPRQRVLLREVDFHTAPEAGAVRIGWSLKRGASVDLMETQGDYARVVYDEYEYDRQSGEFAATSQQEGWIPADALTAHVVHHLFHLQPNRPTPMRWTFRVGERDLEMYWVSLLEDPDLISAQDVWLGCVFDQLRA